MPTRPCGSGGGRALLTFTLESINDKESLKRICEGGGTAGGATTADSVRWGEWSEGGGEMEGGGGWWSLSDKMGMMSVEVGVRLEVTTADPISAKSVS